MKIKFINPTEEAQFKELHGRLAAYSDGVRAGIEQALRFYLEQCRVKPEEPQGEAQNQ
jgi:hypothetical protein